MAKQKKQLTSFPQNLLFHIPSKHKERMLAFRVWIAGRYFLDDKNTGSCDMKKLARFAKIKPETLIKAIRHSKFFRGHGNNRVYFVSLIKVAKAHKLKMRTRFRLEYPSMKFLEQFRNPERFKAYIIKCYFENDPQKKYPKYTIGRISAFNAAQSFGISRRTIQRLVKLSGATSYKHVHEFKSTNIGSADPGNWLLNHAGEKIDGYLIGNNAWSFFTRYSASKKFYLCQQLPNIFRFTGVRLSTGTIRGNGYRPQTIYSHQCRSINAPQKQSTKSHPLTIQPIEQPNPSLGVIKKYVV